MLGRQEADSPREELRADERCLEGLFPFARREWERSFSLSDSGRGYEPACPRVTAGVTARRRTDDYGDPDLSPREAKDAPWGADMLPIAIGEWFGWGGMSCGSVWWDASGGRSEIGELLGRALCLFFFFLPFFFFLSTNLTPRAHAFSATHVKARQTIYP